MCFVNECDWTARVCEESEQLAEQPLGCDECGATIPAGTPYRHIFQQEYEECRDCYNGECRCPEERCCQCAAPTFGETFEYDRCLDCDRFLAAVQVAEEEAGCTGNETRPMLGDMLNAIQEGGIEEARRYVRQAIAMYPELTRSGYLARIWKRMFG